MEDIKRVYSLFLDQHRSTQFLQVSGVGLEIRRTF